MLSAAPVTDLEQYCALQQVIVVAAQVEQAQSLLTSMSDCWRVHVLLSPIPVLWECSHTPSGIHVCLGLT